MHRISLILSQARRGGFTWEFLLDKMEVEFGIQGLEGGYSIRTFQRDLTTIREVYGIDIQFNKRLKKYLINEDDSEPIRMHLLESLDIINAFELASDLGQFVFFDGRRAGGTEHLSPLIGAIKKRVKVRFRHFKNWIETEDFREVSPLALKQVKYSWYLIALNEKEELRNYGLDRIHDLSTTPQKFERPENLNFKEYYQHVFGILNDSTLPVENILLHFSKQQGHYIRSMPIHPSQIIEKDDENGLIVSLQLKINHELISEILSYGDQVKVLEPEVLSERVRRIANKITR
ncbi:WYL domain-containing protein [Algoriphagus marincola]|uniref:WYL domain-containing protein n=1 Tax=Algoriphagus marincola TaxID=264027 RepID=A0ABS7N2I3_9BACT|nr:WYL domain-containing protein [Algoriphagus marincola]MBY5950536.1 WYL domain-containing protein [Algoriphagus marincola]